MNMKGQVSTANFPDRAKRKVEGAAKRQAGGQGERSSQAHEGTR